MRHLSTGGPAHWLADPHLAYKAPGQAAAYFKNMRSAAYYNSVHGPFRGLISDNAGTLAAKLRTDATLHFIDMGPGYPDKSIPVLTKLVQHGQKIVYRPYDVNPEFLEVACEAVRPLATEIQPIHGLFENARLLTSGIPLMPQDKSLLFLGLTFMNFEPAQIKTIFDGFRRFSPFILVGARLLTTGEKLNDLAMAYKSAAADQFAFGPLRDLKHRRNDFVFHVITNGDRIETWYTAKSSFVHFGRKFSRGSSFLTTISYRYTPAKFTSLLSSFLKDVEISSSADAKYAFALGRLP